MVHHRIVNLPDASPPSITFQISLMVTGPAGPDYPVPATTNLMIGRTQMPALIRCASIRWSPARLCPNVAVIQTYEQHSRSFRFDQDNQSHIEKHFPRGPCGLCSSRKFVTGPRGRCRRHRGKKSQLMKAGASRKGIRPTTRQACFTTSGRHSRSAASPAKADGNPATRTSRSPPNGSPNVTAVIKQWVLPTGNDFIKDPSRKFVRPQGNPGNGISFVQPNFDDSSWQPINLPHDWAIAGPFTHSDGGGMGRLPTAGVGWYRKKLDIPATDSGKMIFLDVDGAMSCAAVWFNGQWVGGWPYGYASWQVDLTPYVKPGGANELAIRLDNPPNSSRWYPGRRNLSQRLAGQNARPCMWDIGELTLRLRRFRRRQPPLI